MFQVCIGIIDRCHTNCCHVTDAAPMLLEARTACVPASLALQLRARLLGNLNMAIGWHGLPGKASVLVWKLQPRLHRPLMPACRHQ